MDKLKVITILLVVVGVGWYGLTIEEAETNQVLSERIEITPVVDITATPTIEPTATPSPTLVPTTTSTPTPKKIVITPTPTIVPTPTNTPGPTATPTPIPNITAPADLEPLFSEFSAKYNVSSNMLKKIADCESHFNTAVVSKNGLYAGMFQFAASTWISNRNAMGQNPDLGLRHGARESIETAAYVLSKAGPGAWPACSK